MVFSLLHPKDPHNASAGQENHKGRSLTKKARHPLHHQTSCAEGSQGEGMDLFNMMRGLTQSGDAGGDNHRRDSTSSDKDSGRLRSLSRVVSGKHRRSSKSNGAAQEQDDQEFSNVQEKREALAKQQKERQDGEWVHPVQAFAPSASKGNLGDVMEPAISRMVLPSFYWVRGSEQKALAHRLAVLAVNNYSGEPGKGEEEAGQDPAPKQYKKAKESIGPHATKNQVKDKAKEIQEAKIDKKEKQITQVLKEGDQETLKRLIVPPSLLERSNEVDKHAERIKMMRRQTTERQVEQIHHAYHRDVASDKSNADPQHTNQLSPAAACHRPEHFRFETGLTSTQSDQTDTNQNYNRWEDDMNRGTDEEKLEILTEEFGPIDTLMEPGESERFLVQVQGSLFRGILIIGTIHLTTHRLTFHAILPPPTMTLSGDESNIVLHSGAATIHKKTTILGAPITTRVWMELDSEMITTYPSADDEGRIKPLRSILLDSIDQLYPLDPDSPFEINIQYTTGEGKNESEHLLKFTVDTQESALHWHRDLESALFQHGRTRRYLKRIQEQEIDKQDLPNAPSVPRTHHDWKSDGGWELLTICLPLNRIHMVGSGVYMDFAKLLSLDVDVMSEGAKGNKASVLHKFANLHPFNPTPEEFSEVRDREARRREEQSQTGVFGMFKSHNKAASPQQPAQPPKEHAGGPRVIAKDAHTNGVPVENGRSEEPRRVDNLGESRAPAVGPNTGNMGEEVPAMEQQVGPKDHGGKSEEDGGNQLDANASIVPAQPVKFHYGDHKELRTAVNVKFGVLNETAEFIDLLNRTIDKAHSRKYKPECERPVPILKVGDVDLLKLPEVEGGAGLPDEVLKGPPAPETLPKKSKSEVRKQDNRKQPRHPSTSGTSTGSALHHRGGQNCLCNECRAKRNQKLSDKKKQKIQKAKALFGIPDEDPVWVKRCYLNRTVPFRGHIIISDKYVCFWRKSIGFIDDIKYRIPAHDIKGAARINSIRFKFRTMAMKVAGRHDFQFEFFNPRSLSSTIKRINNLVKEHEKLHHNFPDLATNGPDEATKKLESKATDRKLEAALDNSVPDDSQLKAHRRDQDSRLRMIEILGMSPRTSMNISVPDYALSHLPAIVNDFGARQKLEARKFCLLTIGSRGDVQPYIALALGLMKDGHQVAIVTHDDFKEWVEGYGIEHRQAGGDPAALMKLSVDHAMFSPGFFKESLGHFRTWLDDLLKDAWEACQDADILIESPSAMAGIHIAEALHIPYMRAFTMPWTRTSKYPHAFMVPAVEMGPGYNYSSFVIFDNIIWKATSAQINPWRKKMLNLEATDMSKLSQTKVPFMYNFSPSIVPKPLDWHDDIAITGYWNLANSDTDWSPPDDLQTFMDDAKANDKPLVYIGFGSITVPDPNGMTRNIIKAVDKADVRAIIAKGWSSKGADEDDDQGDAPEFSSNCYPVDKIPHGWLFPKIQAALHHGGAGTVGASLTAGLPTLIKPWFGDQYFWASRVTHLGVGLKVSSLDVDVLADSLDKATRDTVMIERASMIGEKIRREDGVHNAIQYIYSNLPRAGRDRTKLDYQKT